MKRKLFSALLAVAMMASLALPAFASGDSGDSATGGAVNQPMEYTSTTNVPVVTVTMPQNPAVTLNPYGMTVTIASTDYTTQIVSPVYYIENKTEAPMKVGVKATATASGNAVLASKPCTGKETTLSAFVMVEFAQNANNTTAPTWIVDADLTSEKINEKCYPQIIPTTDGKNNPAILSVDKATKSSGTVTPNYIAIYVTGNLAGNPTGGWTSADKVGLKLEFTFTPGVANTVTVPTGITSSKTAAVMGTIVRLTASDKKQPVVTDSTSAAVAVTKVTDELYYFTMPATAVTVVAGA